MTTTEQGRAMPHSALYLQGCKPADEIEVGTVVDGIVGRVQVLEKHLRARANMVPLVILRCEQGENLHFDATFPVAHYAAERKIVAGKP